MTRLTKRDYENLAAFRTQLRKFLHFTEEGARAAGLTPQQHQLMLAVKGRPGREWATVTELAEALQIKHHTTCELVDRCQAAELVVRSTPGDDRRQVHVELTPHGEELLETLSQANRRELAALRKALLPESD